MRKKHMLLRCLTTAFLVFSASIGELPFLQKPIQATEAAAVTTPVIQKTACNFDEIPCDTVYSVMVRLSGKYITVNSNGALIQYSDTHSDNQQWLIQDAGDGFCKFSLASDPTYVWTVENGNGENGNAIRLEPDTGSSAQRFRLAQADDAYTITAECSLAQNTTLDVYDISYEDNAIIDQWNYWGGEGQKFYIRPYENTYTYLRGDLNQDGNLTAADLTILKRAIIQSSDPVITAIADINADGARDNTDAALFTEILCGKIPASFQPECEIPYNPEYSAYLFAYFLGNSPEQEQLSYAVSLDGYHFTALNGGRSVWKSGVGTECLRDPYIFKGEDGLYHLLATDMKSSLGWSSNRHILSAKSTDLVHWFDETQIKIANEYPLMQGADRAWAPQAIYDPEKESYMIYFAARVPGRDDRTIMYYAYSKDLKTLDTDPALLFAPANGNDAIDSDIIFQNGQYYMYYKNETNKRIYLAIADHANGPYSEIKQVSEGSLGVEGPNIYQIIGTNRWVMMSDAYGDGYYVMQETTDFKNFTTVSRNAYSFDFTPRHGYVIPITAAQYRALSAAYPSSAVSPYPYDIPPVSASMKCGDDPSLPDAVFAKYSDGNEVSLPVTWNASQAAALSSAAPGTYTVEGTIHTTEYPNPFIEERADPYMVKDPHSDYYYFTASYPAYGNVNRGYDRIILRRSTTVAGLASAEEKTIWTAHSSGIMAKHIWAPEMHYIGDAWYIYFAAGSSSDIWAIRPYVLRCSGDPYTGTWTEVGQMQAMAGDSESFRSFSLDMTYFSCNGKHYVIWAEIKGDSSLFMAEINPNEPWKLTSMPILLTKPEYDWEMVNNRVNEGASILQTNGKVYLFFSASGTGSEYCIGRMEADAGTDLMDIRNWKKLSHPVLQTANLVGEAGPGHNSFITDENGCLLLVYHARPAAHSNQQCGSYSADPLYDPCRHTRLLPVAFSTDGTPVLTMTGQHPVTDRFRTVTVTVTIY